MHYSSGNYEAFVRPRKPEGADKKTAWFVGSGLAGLAGAAFLIRDGGVSGDRITILEELEIPGGALDGLDVPEMRHRRILNPGHPDRIVDMAEFVDFAVPGAEADMEAPMLIHLADEWVSVLIAADASTI